MNWLDAWPLVLILAVGIGIGRWIERRRARKREAWTGAMSAAIDRAGEATRRGEIGKGPR